MALSNQFLGEKIHKVNLLPHGYLGNFSAFPMTRRKRRRGTVKSSFLHGFIITTMSRILLSLHKNEILHQLPSIFYLHPPNEKRLLQYNVYSVTGFCGHKRKSSTVNNLQQAGTTAYAMLGDIASVRAAAKYSIHVD
jgi:hypothetical protein